jgi:hypothetical protein
MHEEPEEDEAMLDEGKKANVITFEDLMGSNEAETKSDNQNGNGAANDYHEEEDEFYR